MGALPKHEMFNCSKCTECDSGFGSRVRRRLIHERHRLCMGKYIFNEKLAEPVEKKIHGQNRNAWENVTSVGGGGVPEKKTYGWNGNVWGKRVFSVGSLAHWENTLRRKWYYKGQMNLQREFVFTITPPPRNRTYTVLLLFQFIFSAIDRTGLLRFLSSSSWLTPHHQQHNQPQQPEGRTERPVDDAKRRYLRIRVSRRSSPTSSAGLETLLKTRPIGIQGILDAGSRIDNVEPRVPRPAPGRSSGSTTHSFFDRDVAARKERSCLRRQRPLRFRSHDAAHAPRVTSGRRRTRTGRRARN